MISGLNDRPKAPVEVTSAEYVEELRAELGRVDSKASMLLGLAGAGAALVATGAAAFSGPGSWLLAVAGAQLVVAVVVLLSIVRPRIGGPMLAGTEGWRPETQTERLENLARIARRKFGAVRSAVSVLTAASVTAGLGVVLGVVF